MTENKIVCSSQFKRYEADTGEVVLRNIRDREGKLINSSRWLSTARIKNLPNNLSAGDEVSFVADRKLTQLVITHVNFVEVKDA